MMLSDLLGRLARGELKNLSMSVNGEIVDDELEAVVVQVNEGLLRLHSRFVLREDSVLVEMHEAITTYELKAPFAQSYTGDVVVPRRYIMDLGPKKFGDDVIRILSVFDSYGRELELNNQLATTGLFTPRPKILQVPVPIPGQSLSVSYQARHPVLVASEPGSQEVELPDILVGALTAHVGARIFDGIGGQENGIRASKMMSSYEKICVEIEDKDSMGTQTRAHASVFEMRGWV